MLDAAGADAGAPFEDALYAILDTQGDETACRWLDAYFHSGVSEEAAKSVSSTGENLLHRCARLGHEAACEKLVAAGFDPTLPNADGLEPHRVALGFHGEGAGAYRVLEEAHRQAVLGLSKGRVREVAQWAETYKADVKHDETDAMRSALAQKKGTVRERAQWAESYKATVKKDETEAMRKALAEKKGTVRQRAQWAESYKATVKKDETEAMRKALAEKKGTVRERAQWAESYTSPAKGHDPNTSADDAKRVLGSKASELRARWQSPGSAEAPSPSGSRRESLQNITPRVSASANYFEQMSRESAHSRDSAVRRAGSTPDMGGEQRGSEIGAAPRLPQRAASSQPMVAGLASDLPGAAPSAEEEFTDLLLHIPARPLGFQLGDNGGLVTVFGVQPGGNADAAGIQTDDVIAMVNGESLLGLSFDAAMQRVTESLGSDDSFPASVGVRRFVFDDDAAA